MKKEKFNIYIQPKCFCRYGDYITDKFKSIKFNKDIIYEI